MPRCMLDTDDLSKLDGQFELLATYSDLVTDPAELESHFPDSLILYIDRGLGDPGNKATIGDFETGALTVADVPTFLDRKKAEGKKYPTCYSSRDPMDAITQAAAGRPFWRWIATLDGTLFIVGFKPLSGPAAVQILPSQKLDYHADFSVVLEDDWNPTRRITTDHAAKRLLSGAISDVSKAGSSLHRMATLI